VHRPARKGALTSGASCWACSIPERNLRQEVITAENIVELFEKYAVPKPLLVRKQIQQVSSVH